MQDLHIRIEGCSGRITLTRPKALNALNHPMCLAITEALAGWRDDPRVRIVLIDAEGDRAFCAGGDVAQVCRDAMQGNFISGAEFFRDEYVMNAALAEYPKPVVSFMQGYTLGGGIGLGAHVAHRIVGATTQMAMPECAIGLVPDVGGTLLLARAPGHIGTWMGLTGARIGPGAAIAAGFADHFLPEPAWPALIAALVVAGDAGEIAAAAEPAPESPLAQDKAAIDAAFSVETPGQMIGQLARESAGWAEAALAAMRGASPLSLDCTLALIRAVAPGDGIREALVREFRFTSRAAEHADFLEGVRAQLIDKDRRPRWKHAQTAEITPEESAALLAPLGAEELRFD